MCALIAQCTPRASVANAPARTSVGDPSEGRERRKWPSCDSKRPAPRERSPVVVVESLRAAATKGARSAAPVSRRRAGPLRRSCYGEAGARARVGTSRQPGHPEHGRPRETRSFRRCGRSFPRFESSLCWGSTLDFSEVSRPPNRQPWRWGARSVPGGAPVPLGARTQALRPSGLGRTNCRHSGDCRRRPQTASRRSIPSARCQ